ncbi:MAG: Gfo/Idh/MocA family protein [Saccharofermentanales bacterium]
MKIRIGIIGCGAITLHRHAPEYFTNPHCELSGFFDPIGERADQFVKAYGGIAYDSVAEMLSNPDIDAVSVCTSNDTHAAISIQALDSGKHVLCEKPMAVTLEESLQMIQAASRSGKYLMIGNNQRLMPAHLRAKQILESGQMGRVITFKTQFKHQGPEMWSSDKGAHTWFFRKNSSSFGVLGDLGIHKCDLIHWILDDVIDEVFSLSSILDKKNEKGERIEVEDNAICIFRTARGIEGSMEVSWCNYGEEENSTVLYCENGVVKIYVHPDYDIIQEMKDGSTILHKTGGVSTNNKQLKSGIIDAFIESIRNNRPPEISGEEGFKSLAVITGCIPSSSTGRWVGVNRESDVMNGHLPMNK